MSSKNMYDYNIFVITCMYVDAPVLLNSINSFQIKKKIFLFKKNKIVKLVSI